MNEQKPKTYSREIVSIFFYLGLFIGLLLGVVLGFVLCES